MLLTAEGIGLLCLLVTLCTACCRTPFDWAPGSFGMIIILPTVVIGFIRRWIWLMILWSTRLGLALIFDPSIMKVCGPRFPTVLRMLTIVYLVMVGRAVTVVLTEFADSWRLVMPTMLLAWFTMHRQLLVLKKFLLLAAQNFLNVDRQLPMQCLLVPYSAGRAFGGSGRWTMTSFLTFVLILLFRLLIICMLQFGIGIEGDFLPTGNGLRFCGPVVTG